jgi:uncharacterized protein (TIGR02757 family)
LKLSKTELRQFLDEKTVKYNTADFIELDPISIPHRYTQRQDIEISGLLAATISWGNRKMIVKNSLRIMEIMGDAPYDFVMSHKKAHLRAFDGFVHRTFMHNDLSYFITALKHIYEHKGGLEDVFAAHATHDSLQTAIHHFKNTFFELPHPARTAKHISDPLKNSAAKKINMYLRWMVRRDKNGVDFGIWTKLNPAQLSCPLDVHSGNVARKLGILQRVQNDGKAVLELDNSLRKFDPTDPVKYDFALFGLGVYEKF